MSLDHEWYDSAVNGAILNLNGSLFSSDIVLTKVIAVSQTPEYSHSVIEVEIRKWLGP